MSSPVFKDPSFIAPPSRPPVDGWMDESIPAHILRTSMDEVDEEIMGV